jgi:hypothetical protein
MFAFLVGLFAAIAVLLGAMGHLNSVADNAHLTGANGDTAISCDPTALDGYIAFHEDEPCWLIQAPSSGHSTVHTGATDHRQHFGTEQARMALALKLAPCTEDTEAGQACHDGPAIRSSSGKPIPIRDTGDMPDD